MPRKLGPMAVETGLDRKQLNRATERQLLRAATSIVAVPPVVLALVAFVLTRSFAVALVTLVVVAGGFAAWGWFTLRGFGAGFVARIGSTEITEYAQPRLVNVVDGICVAHGLARPTIVGVDGPGANAATLVTGVGSSSTNVLVVSAPLLEALSRIELEGIIARELSTFLDGSASLATFVAALRSLPVVGTVLAGRLDSAIHADATLLADRAGAHMTRYPPGLAAGLDTLGSVSTHIGSVEPAAAALWLADPVHAHLVGDDDPVPSLEVRSAALREL